jgi:hypothetical protein
MDRLTLNRKLNALITDFLEEGGDPAYCADILRQVADEVFEEPDDGPDQLSLWYDTSAELR